MRIKKIKWFLLAHKNENWREAKLICKVKNERRGEHNQQMVFVMPDVSLNAADISVIGRNILPVTLCFHYAPHRHWALEFLNFDIDTFEKPLLWISFRVNAIPREGCCVSN